MKPIALSLILAAVASVAIAAPAAMPAPKAGPPTFPDASTLNTAALRFLDPDKFPWKSAPGLPGAESANLVGDPAKPGFYVVANRFHAGNFSHPHYHPNDRFIMVLRGTWWVSTSPVFDPEHNTVPMKAGTFVTHAARHVHYDGARAGGEDAVVLIFGEGPGSRAECGTLTGDANAPCIEAARTP